MTRSTWGRAHIRVELDGKANDGLCDQSPCATSSEKDNVTGTSATLSGGFGSDLLIGSSENELFEPSQGADVVKAKGGDDEVSLNPGDGADDVLCGGGSTPSTANSSKTIWLTARTSARWAHQRRVRAPLPFVS